MLSKRKKLASLRHDAISIFKKAIQPVHAKIAVHRHCRVTGHHLKINGDVFNLRKYHHVYVVGAGKASAHMGQAIEEELLPKITDGIIVVKYGHSVPLQKIRIVEAGHPIPDAAGLRGSELVLTLVEKATKNDLIICLISGGGSALLPLPVRPLTLADKQVTISALLACGASIDEINVLRKHMSGIKGGRLAQHAYPATLITLILSDVVGDRMDVIASGPSITDPSTYQDCTAIIHKYRLADKMPSNVTDLISDGISGKAEETPKPGDPIFRQTTNFIVGNNATVLSEAKRICRSLGYHALILSSGIEGDTRSAAAFHIAIAREIRKTGNPIPAPACVLSGGETTIRLTGDGLGGRNTEFALACAMGLKHEHTMAVLSAGTDGTDGPTDAAGAVVDTTTAIKALDLGIDPEKYLSNNDSYNFFKQVDGLLMTGPTGTNVMDLRIVLVG